MNLSEQAMSWPEPEPEPEEHHSDSTYSFDVVGQPPLAETRNHQSSATEREIIAPETSSDAVPTDRDDSQVAALLRVSSYLVSVLDPDELLENLVVRVVEALPSVQAGILWLYEARTAKLRAVASFGLPLEPATLALLHESNLSSGEGLAGQALHEQEALLREAHNGYRDLAERVTFANQSLFQQLHEQLPRPLANICIPLRVGSDTIGVLELVNLGEHQQTARPLERSEMPVFQTFGNLAATAIKNAQLYDQAESHRLRLKAFDAVVTAISTATGLHNLVQDVLEVVLGMLPARSGCLLLHDPSQARLTLVSQRKLPDDYVALLQNQVISEAACEEVVRYGQPMLRPLIEEEGEGPLLAAGHTNGVYLPLLAGGTVVGVLGLFGDESLARQADTATLMPICNQIGFAIANVRIYDESQIERNRLNMVINSIAEGVVLCDSQGQLVLANEAAMELLSLEAVPYAQPLSEMPDFYGIRDLENQPLPVEALPLALALSGEVFHDYRVLMCGASGNDSVMSFSGAPVHLGDGDVEGAVVVFRDITANQKLERAKDEFLAVAAHELRSPLAAVRSYTDLLLRREQQRSETDPRDVQGLTILTQQVSHMLRMVDNLLDVSRLDAGQIDLQMQRVNMVSLAGQVIDQQRPAAMNRELLLESGEPEIWLHCDSLRIRQVLTNLVGNAIKFSPPDSLIVLRIGTSLQSDVAHRCTELATLSGEQDSPMLTVQVIDRGAGIPAEQQEKLFQRFYRGTARRTEGLGLGLYLSREFVQMHGGCFWVQSSENQGSTFAFALPMDRQGNG
jgi:two-component system, OmpR family, phosphate regulon sensor histidine kinase PhoR